MSLTTESTLLETLIELTELSNHSHEITLHRLLLDVGDLLALGHLSREEFGLMLGAAVDVLFYFNYDAAALAAEPNRWYRAAVLHQMGQAMLQSLSLERPALTAKAFYREAMAGFALTRDRKRCPPSRYTAANGSGRAWSLLSLRNSYPIFCHSCESRNLGPFGAEARDSCFRRNDKVRSSSCA